LSLANEGSLVDGDGTQIQPLCQSLKVVLPSTRVPDQFLLGIFWMKALYTQMGHGSPSEDPDGHHPP
jgi:hypothetical protein